MVYSARSMSSQPVARVPLPQRVPHGFHGYHIGEHEFKLQQEPTQLHIWPTRGTVLQPV